MMIQACECRKFEIVMKPTRPLLSHLVDWQYTTYDACKRTCISYTTYEE